MPSRQTTSGNRPRRRPSPTSSGGWIWLILLGAVLAMLLFMPFGPPVIDNSDFWKLLAGHHISELLITPDEITGEVKDPDKLPEHIRKELGSGKKFAVRRQGGDDKGELENALLKYQKEYEAKNEELKWKAKPSSQWMSVLVIFVLPTLIILGLFFFFIFPRIRDPLSGGVLNNYIKSPARRYERNKLRVTFDDVADMENAKRELQEVVDFLSTPEKFQRLGAQVPKGVLLVGPPGTGKTLLARAVAGEAGVMFYSISGSEFIQMFVGVGASRVRDMFKTAKENAPCLLFIDEIDAVGRMRGAGVGGGSDEREQTLNQILSEMDGFQPNEMVIVLAATNRPDVLDPALLRPGRFDRHVTIDRPTWHGRMDILKVHTRNKPLADDVNLEYIARKMIGMTGADLRNLTNEAALLAAREGKSKIDRLDFERAADRILIGPKREEVLTPEDKRRTAYHEAGHALVTWHEPGGDRPMKVSIIPRGQSLGMNVSIPEEERFHHGLDYFKARLVMTMGGRAAARSIPITVVRSDTSRGSSMSLPPGLTRKRA